MLSDTPGLHHVTAMVGPPAPNVAFYAETLGLRLVKRTVNQEDMLQHHLYYGNGRGEPGTLFTCFPAVDDVAGRTGKPQVSAAGFVVPPGSLDYWVDRLESRDVDVTGPERRFDERVVRFADPAGTPLELVTGDAPVEPWTGGPVPAAVGIRGLHGVTTLPANPYTTAGTLDTLGFDLVGQEPAGEGDRIRYRAAGERAAVVDVLDREAAFGREGAGTIHHVAVRAASEAELYEWHDLFRERDYAVSRVRDRGYYRALYVREPGGILFELATEEPGLTADEDVDSLGESLALPEQFEADRELIESQLPPLDPEA